MFKPAQSLAVTTVVASLLLNTISPVLAQGQVVTNPTTPEELQNLANTITSQPVVERITTLTAMPVRYGDETQLTLTPGESSNFSLKIRNNSDFPVTVTSLAEDFIIGADYKTPVPVDSSEEDNRWAMASWITVTPALQTIQANTTAAVQIKINVPTDALAGGHYVMVTHQPVQGGRANENATSINQRVGTLVYGIVPGEFTEQAFIRNLTVPMFSDIGPVAYSFLVDNDSEAHIRPRLSAKISNIWGKEVFAQEIESGNIFPKTSRDFAGQWDRIWGVGRYKLEITMLYGTNTATSMASTYFWLFPIWLFLAGLVVLVTLVALIWSVRRHYNHTKAQQAKRMAELEAKIADLEDAEG